MSWFFAAVIGAPSILSLIQVVFIDFTLTDLIQWLLDGYNDLLSVLSILLTPLGRLLIDFIGGLVDVPIELAQHWQPLFVLLAIFISSNTRALFDDGYPKPALIFIMFMVPAALIGAWLAGAVPADSPWWLQGLAVGLPVMLLFTGMFLSYAVSSFALKFRRPYRKPLMAYLFRGARLAIAAYLIAALISATGLIDTHAGILTLFVGLAVYGAYWLRAGFVENDLPEIRFGLRLVGGFIFAMIIIALDIVIKNLT